MLALEGYLSLEVSAGLALTMNLGPNGRMEDVGGRFFAPFLFERESGRILLFLKQV